MCGRYTLTRHEDVTEDLQASLGMSVAGNEWWKPRYNVAPTQPAPVIILEDGTRTVEMMRWGLVPFWATEPGKKAPLMINARAENLHAKQFFRDALKSKRCLVPADGFFEWTGQKGAKTRWRFTPTDQPWFCFAGIWDHAETADGSVDSFALLTTAAGADMQPYHNRQPVILPRAQWLNWLDVSSDPRPLFEAGPAGSLKVELAPASPTKPVVKQPKLDGLF